MINSKHFEEAEMYANYILANKLSMLESAKALGVSGSTVSKRISLLKLNNPGLYDKVKQLTDEIKLEKVRANGRKNNLTYGARLRGNNNF